ncbi:MAG: hypothetical protein ACJ74Z_03735 [Bryobacteraceae bacterium]
MAVRVVFADGGTVQFQKQAGPFIVSVFSAPVPLRVGPADLTVMVQKAADRRNVLNCDVMLVLSKPGEHDVRIAATRARATNKLLYAAPVALPSAGTWHLTIYVSDKRDTARVNGDLAVLPGLPPLIADWPYFALLPMAVALFGLNQWLKTKRKSSNPRARPWQRYDH